MNVPFNGFASAISVQAETAFNAASAATRYALIGKIKFTQAINFGDKTSAIGVWRHETASTYSTKFWNGSIEMDFGFNAVTKMMLSSFFELVSTTSLGGGLSQYIFRPIRLQVLPSFKIGLSYLPGGQNWKYSGVVIDSLTLDFRRNQLPKLTIQFKAANANYAAGLNPLGTPVVTIAGNVSNHTKIAAALSSALDGGSLLTEDLDFLTTESGEHLLLDDGSSNNLANITEYNFVASHQKEAAGFNSSGLANRFTLGGPMTFKGQIAEYFNAGSVFPDAVADQADRPFSFRITDPLGSLMKFSINWPRINFIDGMPDGIGQGDLIYRANFAGLQSDSLDISNEPSFLLVC